MSRNFEADPDGLRHAADLLAELRDNFADISAKATKTMGHMAKACGDDNFGHEFMDGKDGFRAKCKAALSNVDVLSESFDQYAGGSRDGAAAIDEAEKVSGENIRRVV
ncbi:hypothetical protein [Nocardia sp. NBC_01329]|uniref:hypothetical protein n=1 Tax=Nocardia sp. NBC_01329 TaxID=2903594 RepID=UPI002E0D3874|nr:hypothetical protein OG405_11760 [Nocardia sp. NBC_01329]